MSRRTRGIGVAVILVVIAVFTYLRIHGMLQRGEQVVWLAELWAPAAVLSIGLVACLEFLMPSPPEVPPIATRRKKARK